MRHIPTTELDLLYGRPPARVYPRQTALLGLEFINTLTRDFMAMQERLKAAEDELTLHRARLAALEADRKPAIAAFRHAAPTGGVSAPTDGSPEPPAPPPAAPVDTMGPALGARGVGSWEPPRAQPRRGSRSQARPWTGGRCPPEVAFRSALRRSPACWRWAGRPPGIGVKKGSLLTTSLEDLS